MQDIGYMLRHGGYNLIASTQIMLQWLPTYNWPGSAKEDYRSHLCRHVVYMCSSNRLNNAINVINDSKQAK